MKAIATHGVIIHNGNKAVQLYRNANVSPMWALNLEEGTHTPIPAMPGSGV